jgi:hypothetical protein
MIRYLDLAFGITALLVWITVDRHDWVLMLGGSSWILAGMPRSHDQSPWSNHPSIRA